jgi:murE/murF fusion protein
MHPMDNRKNITSHARSLKALLQGVDYKLSTGSPVDNIKDISIDFVTCDSRNVLTGTLFVAIKGAECDGHDFVSSALINGCVAVICEAARFDREQLSDWDGVLIEVEDSGKAYGVVAGNYHGRPAESLTLVGVTGTNGKTTVTFLLEHVLLHAGLKVGVIGTVNNRYVGDNGETVVLSTPFTTPEALMLQQVLREMADAGVNYVIMEVSSHALAQNRISNIRFKAAAFTNLSRDHLDYHLSMEEYFSAKLRLFTEHMAQDGIAVLPADAGKQTEQVWNSDLVANCQTHCKKIICWGDGGNADIRLLGYDSRLDQTVLNVQLGDEKQVRICSRLVGRFNIDNILTVLGLSSALEIDLDSAVSGLEQVVGAPGRLERVMASVDDSLNGPVVFVDYAHTPDALEQVLSTVASLPHGELYCVFGCGGDRDSGKRQVMGEIASRFGDAVIVTDDNPRTEDPDQIVGQILEGINLSEFDNKPPEMLYKRKAGDKVVVVERDRGNAIRLAITCAAPEDVVLIAGKGHETYQLGIKGKRFFDDRLEAKKVLCSWTNDRITKGVGGKILGIRDSVRLLGEVTTDSRKVSNDSIFVALKGEKYDGHEFASQAVENGATCLLVEREIGFPEGTGANVSQVVVADTLKSLGDMAAYRRSQLAKVCDQTVIGITGSCGKTTVKEMVASILRRKWPEGPEYPEGCVLKTQGNFNNLIGMPLSLLPLNLTHRAAVLEMGMNQPGELRRLTEIADPDISCIINIHGAHLEGLHSIEGVAHAKEELFAGTKKSGILVVNIDDQRVDTLARKYDQAKITFTALEENLNKNPDMWATNVDLKEPGVITFTMHHGKEEEDIHLYAAGEHNVSNAMAAAAIAYSCGANIREIAAGLADFRPPDKRMEMLRVKDGYNLLNDTYNANPASMAVGLKTLKQMAGRQCAAILGDMLELGETSKVAHYELGQLIAKLQINRVGLFGQFKEEIMNGALAGGMDSMNIRLFDEKQGAVDWVNQLVIQKKIGQDDFLLVKASRGLRFETIVQELVA